MPIIRKVAILSRAVDYSDDETGAHVRRVGQYCEALARRVGLGEQVVERIKACRPLHDVGQIDFPMKR
jgi:putative two-component system response regulator